MGPQEVTRRVRCSLRTTARHKRQREITICQEGFMRRVFIFITSFGVLVVLSVPFVGLNKASVKSEVESNR